MNAKFITLIVTRKFVDHRDEGRNRIAALPGEGSGSVGSFVIAIERVDDAFLPLNAARSSASLLHS
ncbi:MAG: hypothetical protein IPI91_17065 [Flavobacteriales bacterium]|nr:hypothetical protein [Flavobacteriales bacterium]